MVMFHIFVAFTRGYSYPEISNRYYPFTDVSIHVPINSGNGNYEWETINEWDVLSMGSIVSQEYPN